MSHNLKSLEQRLIQARDIARDLLREAEQRHERGEEFTWHAKGLHFGQVQAYELALDFLNTFTEGEFGQEIAEQRQTAQAVTA